MQIFSADRYLFELPAGHRFPLAKYAALREAVEQRGFEVRDPPLPTIAELAAAHDVEYLEKVRTGRLDDHEQRRIGLPWSADLVARAARSCGATLAAARGALEDGIGVNLAGGTHHASSDHGEGFCIYNDVAVSLASLLQRGAIERALVIDTDVHQGNGTAAIFAAEPAVVTADLYCARNFPFRKVAADIDIGLAEQTEGAAYLDALHAVLGRCFERGPFDLVAYLAGADPHRLDRLGRLALEHDDLRQRDHAVLDACRARGWPVVVTMAGGYPHRLEDTVAIHVATVEVAAELHGCTPGFGRPAR